MSRKVIVVAQEVLHSYFQENYVDWEVQDLCEDINSLWEGTDNGTFSEDTEIVIFHDEIYESTPEEFAEAVAIFSSSALVMILSYNSIEEYITQSVSSYVADNKDVDEAPYYFIDQKIAPRQIEETVDFYDNGQHEAEKERNRQKAVAIEVNPNKPETKVDTSRDGLVVTVTSSKGGSGKSTVGILLATQLAQSSKKAYEAGLAERPLDVCVVDLDTFDGQLGFVIGAMTPTALNIALSESIFDADLVASNLVYNERMGIHALLAPVRGSTARLTGPKFYKKTIDVLRTMFDVVILDTSVQHYDDLIHTVALPEADAILVVTTLDIKSVKGLARWMDVARKPVSQDGHGVDQAKIGIVVNGSIQGVGMGNAELTTAALGAKLLVAIPLDTKAVQAAGNANRLEDIIEHPTIGPEYYKLATRLGKARGFKLLPVLEEPEAIDHTSGQQGATRPGQKESKGGLFTKLGRKK